MLQLLEEMFADAPAEDVAKAAALPLDLRRKLSALKRAIAAKGDARATGHATILIPKGNLSAEDAGNFGFQPARGMAHWGLPGGGYYLSEGPDHWRMFADAHPALTRTFGAIPGAQQKVEAIRASLEPLFGQACPGMGHYLLSRVRRGPMVKPLAEEAAMKAKNPPREAQVFPAGNTPAAVGYADDATVERLTDEVMAQLEGV